MRSILAYPGAPLEASRTTVRRTLAAAVLGFLAGALLGWRLGA